MKVLGVDCSTQSFAFAIFDDGKLIRWGEVSFGKGDVFHRMNNANRVMNVIAKDPDFQNIDKVAFEAATFVQNRRTVILLAYAFGAALAPFVGPGVKVIDVPPITWQSYIGNKPFTKAEKETLKKRSPGQKESWYKEEIRKARKQRTVDWVKDKFGVTIKSDNISDAIGAGFYVADGGADGK